ncbi:MAG TPA: tetratricopeptide repeat protein [Hyalangium sp.]|jgi:tetratricopeptide (TPR) repeat protein|nr:tetratricopeptide repeat protein [Hyalangium sp.]
MVLPPSVADDAPGPDVTGWLRRLKVILGLARAGVLVLVDHASPERLGDLVRALLPTHPELEVHGDARKLVGVKPGSTVVLVPRAEDADWLNINRPLFALNSLRVVLFAPREVSVALARGAVDFFDWISHRLECIPGPAPFAVAGLRRALAIRAPGIVWKGGDLVAAFREVRPRGRLRTVSVARPYEELVAEIWAARGDWLAWTDVDGDFRLRRVRWALAEARCRTRTILVEPPVPSPGWWELHGRVAEFRVACERLERAGAIHAGRLAALVDLEPEAIELLGELLEQGMPEQTLEAEISRGADAGAAMGRLAAARGLVREKDLVRGRASPPAMRAFSENCANTRLLQGVEARELIHRIERGEWLEPEDAWWAASTTRRFPASTERFERQGGGAEVRLRHDARTEQTWEELAAVALLAGDVQVAHVWALRAAGAGVGKPLILAQVLIEEGRWTEAESVLRRQLAVDPSGARGRVLYELARVLERQGRYMEAKEVLRHVLTLSEVELGEGYPGYGASLHALAVVLERQGRYSDAEELLVQVRAFNEKALGKTHPDYATSLHELARVLERQGRYVEAEELLHQGLATLKSTVGSTHPRYAASLRGMARIMDRQGQYAHAEELLRQACAINERTLGTSHPEYVSALRELGRVLERRGQYAEAEKLLRQALAIQTHELDVAHRNSGATLYVLARVLGRQGRYAEAEELLHQVRALLEKAQGGAHPDHAASLRELARVLERQGRYAEAESWLRQALAIEEKAQGVTHPDLCSALTLLGGTLTRQSRPAEGEPLLQRAVEIALKTWGQHHPVTAQALHGLAQAEAAMKKPQAAATAKQAKEALLKALGPEHPITKESLPELDLILDEQRGNDKG